MTTLPNLLSLGRIALVPALVGTFYLSQPAAAWTTFGIFAMAALSDFLDGYLARMLDQGSALGRVLDPIADKLIVAAALVMLAVEGRAAVLAVVAILCRELLVSGLREGLAGRLTLPVSRLAKAKTAGQMLALAVLLLTPAFPGAAAQPLETAGTALLWLAVALSWITALDYLRAALRGIARAE
jgi:cardiolipin synthase